MQGPCKWQRHNVSMAHDVHAALRSARCSYPRLCKAAPQTCIRPSEHTKVIIQALHVELKWGFNGELQGQILTEDVDQQKLIRLSSDTGMCRCSCCYVCRSRPIAPVTVATTAAQALKRRPLRILLRLHHHLSGTPHNKVLDEMFKSNGNRG